MSMKCPSCGNILRPVHTSGITVQTCRGGCGGFWFARAQLKKMTGPPGEGQDLLKIEGAPGVRIFRDVEHQCTQCTSTLLLKLFSSRDLDIEIDQCSKCSGLWLETGRLSTPAPGKKSAGPDQTAPEDYFAEIFERCVSGMDITNPDVQEAAQLIVKVLRWISPKDFLSGKKIWWIVD